MCVLEWDDDNWEVELDILINWDNRSRTWKLEYDDFKGFILIGCKRESNCFENVAKGETFTGFECFECKEFTEMVEYWRLSPVKAWKVILRHRESLKHITLHNNNKY